MLLLTMVDFCYRCALTSDTLNVSQEESNGVELGETATQQRITTEDSRRTREGSNRGSDQPPYRVEQRFPTSREIQ